jgi:methyl-accepting chemotaxis protein
MTLHKKITAALLALTALFMAIAYTAMDSALSLGDTIESTTMVGKALPARQQARQSMTIAMVLVVVCVGVSTAGALVARRSTPPLKNIVNEVASAADRVPAAAAPAQVSSSVGAKSTQLIDEIAFRTNLLSLSAAVDTARAAEAEVGVAVIADELRQLAKLSPRT